MTSDCLCLDNMLLVHMRTCPWFAEQICKYSEVRPRDTTDPWYDAEVELRVMEDLWFGMENTDG